MSTMEMDYCVIVNAGIEGICIQQFLGELGVLFEAQTVIYYDNHIII